MRYRFLFCFFSTFFSMLNVSLVTRLSVKYIIYYDYRYLYVEPVGAYFIQLYKSIYEEFVFGRTKWIVKVSQYFGLWRRKVFALKTVNRFSTTVLSSSYLFVVNTIDLILRLQLTNIIDSIHYKIMCIYRYRYIYNFLIL